TVLFNKFTALNVGDVFQYEKGTDGYWYDNDGNKVEGIIGKFCDYTLNQVQNEFDDIIKDFTLGEVIVHSGNSNILTLLEDVKIEDLEIAIENMYVGEIMGYSYYMDGATPVWYKDADNDQNCDAGEDEIDTMIEVIAGYKVSELSDSTFSGSLINSISAKLTLKDLGIKRSDSTIFQVFATDEEFESLTIDTLPDALASKFSGDMKLSMLQTIGMYTFDDGAKDMIVKLTGKAWENITVNHCFESVFGLGADSPVSTLEKLGMYTFTATQKTAIVALYNSTKADDAPVRTWESLTVSEFLNTVMSKVPGSGSGT
ncbi:MAG: hypothetical protein IJA15_08325, partial [Clostridia bacterium]|nr:hypothetical protein [Clostridia bacterium]